ncbi:hypothetical protein AB0N09_21715 [Streptomyces erythrochromogenes]|uniref:hypothetical protein n=1 Tax=Streptomyces erythrochromogenes TaxID=285574 RepID=UPI003439AC1A
MTTEERARWNAQEVREPGQVPTATPLAWQVAKLTDHADRLMNNLLPADFPHDVEHGTADDALAVLALRESIRRDVEHGRGTRIHEALLLGASWPDVARALDIEPDEARELLRAWAQGQRNLWQRHQEEGRWPLGLDADAYAAVLAVAERDDDEEDSDGCTNDCDGADMCVGTARTAKAPAPAPVVRPETLRYAEELRRNPGTASADGHAGWDCTAGATLHVEAMTPGPGRLGTLHGVIYVCTDHRAAAEERIRSGGYEPEVEDAPAGHRHDPWPCGHLTTYRAAALAALSAPQEQR